MNNKELEIQRAEQVIMDRLPPIVRTFVFNSKKVDETIEKYEVLLMSCMNDNGTVNGELLGAILEHKFPKVAEWINIPKNNFYLKDEIGVLLDFIFGGNYYGK